MADDIKQVGDIDFSLRTSEIVTDEPNAGDTDRATCYFNGAAYSTGAQICSGGNLLYCQTNGAWRRLGGC